MMAGGSNLRGLSPLDFAYGAALPGQSNQPLPPDRVGTPALRQIPIRRRQNMAANARRNP
ncbi:MAG TPA: hypothetical protein VFU81_10550 [Thermomicrobiales bacterium]|nr:hypothetical protein [Thermomicrobiales bacterium]